jgi:hypothetical protein
VRPRLVSRPSLSHISVTGRVASGGALSEIGQRVVRDLLADVKAILGPDFPVKTFRKFRRLPPELLLAAGHRSVLPMFLAFAIHLRHAAVESTFGLVLGKVVGGVDVPAWYHLRLQLETAWACRAMGVPVSYEPPRRLDRGCRRRQGRRRRFLAGLCRTSGR